MSGSSRSSATGNSSLFFKVPLRLKVPKKEPKPEAKTRKIELKQIFAIFFFFRWSRKGILTHWHHSKKDYAGAALAAIGVAVAPAGCAVR